MDFFEEHKKQIMLAITAILLVVILITYGKKKNATIIESALGFVLTPVQELTTDIGNWVGSKIDWIRDKDNLATENEQLKEQIALLETENKRLRRYGIENQRLSELLKISQKYANYHTVGTKIIAKDPGNWYDIFLIDKGKKDHLEANMVLTASNGLVGKIIETGETYSKAQSILDSRSSVPAMSLRTEDLGVVKGEYSLMNHGLCRMEYIDSEAEIIEGDEIVTSNLSDVYPSGITIGRVKEIKTEANGLTKYAIIEPYVDFKHLDTLLVIGDIPEAETPVETPAEPQTETTTEPQTGTPEVEQ